MRRMTPLFGGRTPSFESGAAAAGAGAGVAVADDSPPPSMGSSVSLALAYVRRLLPRRGWAPVDNGDGW